MLRFASHVLSRWPALLLPCLLTLACDGVAPSGYTIKWVFVNNSGTTAIFTGTDGDNDYSRTVNAHEQIGPHESKGLLPGKHMDVVASVVAGAVNRTQTKSVPVSGGGITTVTITWDGTTMDVSAFIQCTATLRGPGLRAANTANAADDCGATTWTLDAINGVTTRNWTGNTQTGIVTGNGTLTINFPQEVEAGSAATLGFTFNTSLNWQGPGAPAIILQLKIFAAVSGAGYIADVSKNIGTPNPTISGSATATANFTFPPETATVDHFDFQIDASMNLFNFFFEPITLTYRKT